jgi:site-specific recombinase XerD
MVSQRNLQREEQAYLEGKTTGDVFDELLPRSGLVQWRLCTQRHRRHTFAISFLEAGGDIRKLSRAMGHSSLAITEKFYGKWSKKEKEILHEELRAALPRSVIAKT